jgi:hypothetical protein
MIPIYYIFLGHYILPRCCTLDILYLRATKHSFYASEEEFVCLSTSQINGRHHCYLLYLQCNILL